MPLRGRAGVDFHGREFRRGVGRVLGPLARHVIPVLVEPERGEAHGHRHEDAANRPALLARAGKVAEGSVQEPKRNPLPQRVERGAAVAPMQHDQRAERMSGQKQQDGHIGRRRVPPTPRRQDRSRQPGHGQQQPPHDQHDVAALRQCRLAGDQRRRRDQCRRRRQEKRTGPLPPGRGDGRRLRRGNRFFLLARPLARHPHVTPGNRREPPAHDPNLRRAVDSRIAIRLRILAIIAMMIAAPTRSTRCNNSAPIAHVAVVR